jgi:hypothetical protein
VRQGEEEKQDDDGDEINVEDREYARNPGLTMLDASEALATFMIDLLSETFHNYRTLHRCEKPR